MIVALKDAWRSLPEVQALPAAASAAQVGAVMYGTGRKALPAAPASDRAA
jgi:hypothetical protein